MEKPVPEGAPADPVLTALLAAPVVRFTNEERRMIAEAKRDPRPGTPAAEFMAKVEALKADPVLAALARARARPTVQLTPDQTAMAAEGLASIAAGNWSPGEEFSLRVALMVLRDGIAPALGTADPAMVGHLKFIDDAMSRAADYIHERRLFVEPGPNDKQGA
jgi:hypothetical protein